MESKHTWSRLVRSVSGGLYVSRVCPHCQQRREPGTRTYVIEGPDRKALEREVTAHIQGGWKVLSEVHGRKARKITLVHPVYLIPEYSMHLSMRSRIEGAYHWEEEEMIKGLTSCTTGRLPVEFVLRKGEAKQKGKNKEGKEIEIVGKDLDHFRFVPADPEDDELAQCFTSTFGDNPRRIEVFLPYSTVDENFENSMVEFNASYQVIHRCDGENILFRDPITGRFLIGEQKCPFAEMALGDKKRKCSPNGILYVLIKPLHDHLHRGFSGMMVTGSMYDIRNIYRSLQYWAGPGQQFEGRLKGMPFVLTRERRTISTPTGEGKRSRTSKWLVFLEISSTFWERMIATTGEAPALAEAPKQLEAARKVPEWMPAFIKTLADPEGNSLTDRVTLRVSNKVVAEVLEPQDLLVIQEIPWDRKDLAGEIYKRLQAFDELRSQFDFEGHLTAFYDTIKAMTEENAGEMMQLLKDTLDDLMKPQPGPVDDENIPPDTGAQTELPF